MNPDPHPPQDTSDEQRAARNEYRRTHGWIQLNAITGKSRPKYALNTSMRALGLKKKKVVSR